MITPSRWLTKQGRGLSIEWVDNILRSDHFLQIHDYLNASDCFTNVEIKGGICYFLYAPNYVGSCKYSIHQNNVVIDKDYNLSTWGMAIRDAQAEQIICKVKLVEGSDYINTKSFSNIVCTRHHFDQGTQLSTSWRDFSENKSNTHNIKCYLNKQLLSCGYGWVSLSSIPKNHNSINQIKIYISKAYGAGENFPHQILGIPFIGENNSVCTDTYIVIKPTNGFNNMEEGKNAILYIKSQFFRYLVFVMKKTQDAPRDVYKFVPLQDFTSSSDIDWSKSIKEIDRQLYAKYNLSEDEIAFIEKMIKPMA
jgi:hypothetical protein